MMRYFFAVILSFSVSILSAATIESNSSGPWSSPSTWFGGVVPGSTDDVIIQPGDVIHMDIFPNSPDSILTLCNNLTVLQGAVLRLGHDNNNRERILEITGNILCDGTISSGREVPPNINSGQGLLFAKNSSLMLSLSSNQTEITGRGFLNPKDLVIRHTNGTRTLKMELYNAVLDRDFVVEASDSLYVEIDHNSYLNIHGTLGITGRTYASSPSNGLASLTLKGIILCENLGLYTKNPNLGSGIRIMDEGILITEDINLGNSVQSANGGFDLFIDDKAIFRCGENADDPLLLASNDPNLTVTNNGQIKLHYNGRLTSGTQVMAQITPYMEDSCNQPVQIRDAIGASHIAGWYNFTQKPYLLEGIDKFKEWGSRNIKTTISPYNGKMFSAYHFNHSWPNFNKLVDVVKHPFVDSLFGDPYFTTHAFWAPPKNNKGFYKDGPDFNHHLFQEEENQIYAAAKYILEEYGDMEKRFIFQNWEGDWMLRGNNRQWEANPSSVPDDIEWQIEGMARMWRARMRGIERAVAEFPNAKAKIQYSVEFNKLFRNVNGTRQTMMEIGTPCLIADVIPKVRMHLSSWSAYDGNFDEPSTDRPFPTGLWNGLEIATYFTNSTKNLEGIPAMLGEFGMNENPPYGNLGDNVVRDRYDKVAGMVSALGVQNVYYWNLFGSGQQAVSLDKGVQYDTAFLYQVLDGKWIVEPDGSWGAGASLLKDKYFSCPDPDTTGVTHINIVPHEAEAFIHPNPASDFLHIDLGNETGTFTFYDLSGRRIYQDKYQGAGRYDISSLANGIYVMEIQTSSGKTNRKRIVVSK